MRVRKLRGYGQFSGEKRVTRLLLEGKLTATDRFLSRLGAMKGNAIASTLLDAFASNRDIPKNLNHNWIDVSDADGMITFTSDRNAETRFDNDPARVYASRRDPFSVGKFARGILPELGYRISGDREIEEFVNLYKASKVDNSRRFQMVSGPAIKDYYIQSSYAGDTGSLAKSCMRYERCQSFFSIYTDNTDKCRLLVYLDENNLLLGRAIVWKLHDYQLFVDPSAPYTERIEFMMDRVYTVTDSDLIKFVEYANSNGWLVKNRMSASNEESLQFKHKGNLLFGRVSVRLDNMDFDEFPYLDTVKFCDGDRTVSNVGFYVDPGEPNAPLGIIFNNTDGSASHCAECDGSGQDQSRTDRCKKCKGRGYAKCADCGGTNKIMCDDCGGRGKEECTRCGARGVLICPDCKGDVRVECGNCESSGQAKCVICEGRGNMGRCDECQEGKVVCGNCNGQPLNCASCEGDGRVYGDDGSVPCPACGGAGSGVSGTTRVYGCRCPECSVGFRGGWRNEGKVLCQKCEGDGTVVCPVNCNDGYMECETCSGKGRYKCKNCRNGLLKCPGCVGKKYLGTCARCHGSGTVGNCSCVDGKKPCEACNKTGVRGRITEGPYKCSECAGLLEDFIVKKYPETRIN
jgi:hypothetical protein